MADGQQDQERKRAAEAAKCVLAKHPHKTLGSLGCPSEPAGRERTEREARTPVRPEPQRDR